MGCLTVIVCLAAAALLYWAGSAFGTVALINAIANLWSLGIMHNYGGSRTVDSKYESIVTTVNLVTAFVGVGLLVYGLVRSC